jgi:translation initiation factor 3 subunit I
VASRTLIWVLTFYSRGDLLFSVSKDHIPSVWFSHNGERLGTYHGHQGAVWTIDCTSTTTLLATGAADNTLRLWNVKDGKNIKTWKFETAVKRVEFSEDDKYLLALTERRMGWTGSVVVFPITNEENAERPLLFLNRRILS